MMRIALFGLLLIAAPLTDAHARECYEGTATINQQNSGKKCTLQEKGYYNSSAGPKTHDGCTAAKADARKKLIARIQKSCAPYVQTNAPCTVININRCT